MIDKIIEFLFFHPESTKLEICEGLGVTNQVISTDMKSLYQDGYIKMNRKDVKKPTGNYMSVQIHSLGPKGTEYYHNVIERMKTDNTAKSDIIQNLNAKKIFISHTYSNKNIANRLIDNLILPNFNLENDRDIFFTSNRRMGIRSSLNWRNKIKSGISECQIFIAIITPDFKTSEMCLGEVGAAWILQKSIHPLIIPPIEYKNFNVVISDLQAEDISNKSNLTAFIDSLAIDLLKKCNIGRKSNSSLELQINTFHKYITNVKRKFINHT